MQIDIFGDEIDEFETCLDQYGIFPLTVWDCDFQDIKTKRLKKLIGDYGENRTDDDGYVYFAGAKRKAGSSAMYTGKAFGSFNPAVAAWLLNCFAPEAGVCFDPFAGGGTRAIMAAKYGLDYIGVELRECEALGIFDKAVCAGVSDKIEIINGDSRCCESIQDNKADFLMTCPPYWNLEQYNGGESDLSMATSYEDFLIEIEKTIKETRRILKKGANSCWVVGLFRNGGQGLLAMNHDIAKIHMDNGFIFKEEIILAHRNNGAVQRVGNFKKGNNFLIRTHEYAQVFIAD